MNTLTARPGLWASVLIGITAVLAAYAFANLKVEGDVARALKGTSDTFLAHQTLEAHFGAPSKDEVFLVRAPDLANPDTFRAFEDLVIDLQLTDGVRAVLSIFSLPDPAGDGISFLARDDVRQMTPADQLDGLINASPLARYLMSQNHDAALLAVMPDLSVPNDVLLASLGETTAYADPSLVLKPVSLAALQREISSALVKDQLFVAPVASILCIAIALFLFRSWRAAVLCALPSMAGLGWTFAAMTALGYPMEPFMAIVPTLLIVLGIADSVHVFHAVRRHTETVDLPEAIRLGLAETMPAVILASVTTALAFLCLLLVGSPTVASVAIIGPIGLALTTLAVFLALPPAIMLLFRNVPTGRSQPLHFHAITSAAIRLLAHDKRVVIAAFAILGALLLIQTQTVTGYRIMDHIPRDGAFRETLAELDSVLPGSDQSFVMLPAADPVPGISDADQELLARAGQALYGTDAGIIPTRNTEGIEHALLTRFQGDDGRHFALPLIGRLDLTSSQMQAFAQTTSEALKGAGVSDFIVTGYSQMSSIELPIVVGELRVAFYVAVALVTVLAALLLRSARIALLSLVPNLIPILAVEAWLALTDRPLTIIGAIAFTIAFGIAVDDTIHLMNRIRISRPKNAVIDRAIITTALRATAPPVITTSIILLTGFTVTAFSLLPSISLFGQLTAAAMVVALLADLFLFPSLLCWGEGKAKDS